VVELRREDAKPLKFYGKSEYSQSDDVSEKRKKSVHLKDFPPEGEAEPLVDVGEEIERLEAKAEAKAEAKENPEKKSPGEKSDLQRLIDEPLPPIPELPEVAEEKEEEEKEAGEEKEVKEGNLQLVAVDEPKVDRPNDQLANVRE
jgi:hypothetical protein